MVSYALYQSVNEHIIEKKYRIYRIYSKIIYNQTWILLLFYFLLLSGNLGIKELSEKALSENNVVFL